MSPQDLPPPVTAVVVTHARPALATRTVRMLVEDEGVAPSEVVLVVNGVGGLDDRALEAAVDVVRLPENTGPAGGFRAGFERARAAHAHRWIYACEDDACLVELERPVVREILDRIARHEARGRPPIGAVAAYARTLDPRTGQSSPHEPAQGGPELQPVDCAAWGSTLVNRDALDAGVLPDPTLFFGFEDFDFFLSLRRVGFGLYVDRTAARRAARQVTQAARAERFHGVRPHDDEEPWRQYYLARNFIELTRRHGRRRWLLAHALRSVRRVQRAPARGPVARATLRGWWDGLRRRLGAEPRYQRRLGAEGGGP